MTVSNVVTLQPAQGILQFFRLLQFSDSTLPVGSFAFSNGLESAVQTGIVKDAVSLEHFVRMLLRQSAGLDGVALLHAYRATRLGDQTSVAQADAALWARRVGEEQQQMTARMGRKFAELALRFMDSTVLASWLAAIRTGETPGCYAVGQGIVLAELGASSSQAFSIHQYGVASMTLGAAVRLMRIDHFATQQILFQLSTLAQADYDRVEARPLDEMSAFAPVFDVLVGHHSTAHVRNFMN